MTRRSTCEAVRCSAIAWVTLACAFGAATRAEAQQVLPSSRTFDEDPAVVGVTPIRAVHFTQLRSCLVDVGALMGTHAFS